MKKPYWLKKKYLMYRFNGLFFSSISRVKETKEKKKMKEKKNLLVQIDGMGDCFIRLGLLNLMEQKYGKDKKLAFDLIIPSLPGFGFSSKPNKAIGARETAKIFNCLIL